MPEIINQIELEPDDFGDSVEGNNVIMQVNDARLF